MHVIEHEQHRRGRGRRSGARSGDDVQQAGSARSRRSPPIRSGRSRQRSSRSRMRRRSSPARAPSVSTAPMPATLREVEQQRFGERSVGDAHLLVAPPGQHYGALVVERATSQLLHEPRLADARLARTSAPRSGSVGGSCFHVSTKLVSARSDRPAKPNAALRGRSSRAAPRAAGQSAPGASTSTSQDRHLAFDPLELEVADGHEHRNHPDRAPSAAPASAASRSTASPGDSEVCDRGAAGYRRGLAAHRPPSSSGLGHHPLKVAARVRIPLGVPLRRSAALRAAFVQGRFWWTAADVRLRR